MLKHRFKNMCYDKDFLFNKTTTLSQFMTKLRKQSHKYPDNYEPDTYYGDGFEALIESLIHQLGTSTLISCKNYTPVMDDDLGVDGYGYGPDGEIHTVQIKARSNPTSVLTANKDHISNFVAHSHSKFGGDSKVKYLTIFTTAQDLHHVAQKMYDGEVNVIHNKKIESVIDNNPLFWEVFRDQMMTS